MNANNIIIICGQFTTQFWIVYSNTQSKLVVTEYGTIVIVLFVHLFMADPTVFVRFVFFVFSSFSSCYVSQLLIYWTWGPKTVKTMVASCFKYNILFATTFRTFFVYLGQFLVVIYFLFSLILLFWCRMPHSYYRS